jgi:hypothetical protein
MNKIKTSVACKEPFTKNVVALILSLKDRTRRVHPSKNCLKETLLERPGSSVHKPLNVIYFCVSPLNF